MSINRYNAQRDSNEPEIVKAYESLGCSVHRISGTGVPDLLIGYKGFCEVAEVKGKKGKLTKDQIKFESEFNGEYRVVREFEDVINHVNKLIYISEKLGRLD